MGLHACTLCELTLLDDAALHAHSSSDQHRLNFVQNLYTVNREFMMRDKNGVQVSSTLQNDCPDYVKESEGRISMYLRDGRVGKTNVHIKNGSSESVMLENIMTLYKCANIRISDKHCASQGKKKLSLNKGATYAISFEALEGGVGVQELPVVFHFTRQEDTDEFHILKILCVQFLDDISAATLPISVFNAPKSQYHMLQPPRYGYVPGKPIPGDMNKNPRMVFQHYYPETLRRLVMFKFDIKKIKDPELLEENGRIRRLMTEGLTPYNHKEWYETQLWIEEIQKELDLKRYHQCNVPLFRSAEQNFSDYTECIELNVPGLMEKRPHIMLGDSVFLRYAGKTEPIFEGIVHRIEEETIHLAFADEFMNDFLDGTLVDIQFWFSRVPFIRCHAALQHTKRLRNVLFPCMPLAPCPEPEQPLQFYDTRVSNNKEQKQAVIAMVHEYSAPAPYILFGPPGTGKTLTIVEAIKQIYKVHHDCHMLVCGPSNSSCDLLTERLMDHIPREHIIRVNAKSRQVRTIPDRVKQVSPIHDNAIMMPKVDVVATYRIVVTTFMSAAKVVMPAKEEMKLESAFTHVFLDECGHGQEPEALVPLLGLGRMVVLAGDPKQLGPVVQSRMCYASGRFFKGDGLDQSLLERLMSLDLYKPNRTGQYNSRMVTKLLDNYRSHKAILHIPNELFYDSELRTCGDENVINKFLGWKHLVNKKVPLVFHGVNGKDAREGNNPSYFNPQEVSKVIYYVKKLRNDPKVKPKDIGIVVPYKAQIHKIRDALSTEFGNWVRDLRVGSPEQFQGDERSVIIVSTVRASAELLHNDVYQQLGFLRNPKRFNVAVTRAQAMLIVVGCPWLLQRDKSWGALLKYCHRQNCYHGCNYDPLERNEIEDVYRKLDELNINVRQGEEEDEGC